MDVELTSLASQWAKVGPVEVKSEKQAKIRHVTARRKKDLERPGKPLGMVIEEG